MSLLYYDGMDSYDTATMDRRWVTVSGASISTTVQRTGSSSLYLNADTDYAIALNPKNDPISISEIKIGFAFRYALGAVGSIVSVWDWTDLQCYLVLNATGKIDFYRGDGTLLDEGVKILSESTWYYIEWYVSIANVGAAWTVKINEAQDFAEVTGDTQSAPTADIVYVRFGDVDNSSHNGLQDFWVDDFYMVDPTDAVWPDEFLGDVRVDRLDVASDGASTDWDVVGAPASWQAVNEVPPNDETDFLFERSGGAATVMCDVLPFTPSTIYGIQTLVCAQGTAPLEELGLGVVSGAFYGLTASQNCSLEWDYFVELYPVDPDGSVTWTVAETATIEYGVQRMT